jgi:hypothetical protein
MANPIDRWYKENEERDGHYAVLSGFEKDIRQDELLCEAYEAMDIYDQLRLFSFVCNLLDECNDWARPSQPTKDTKK